MLSRIRRFLHCLRVFNYLNGPFINDLLHKCLIRHANELSCVLNDIKRLLIPPEAHAGRLNFLIGGVNHFLNAQILVGRKLNITKLFILNVQ